MYCVYILQSMVDASFYIGFTNDPDKRLTQHNAGESRYTSKKIPWKLVYTESFTNKSEAIQREKFLKKQKNRSFNERLIKEHKQ